MAFQWQIPNQPLDPMALERMMGHFRKPKELMPEAWFMGREIFYFTWLAEEPPDTLDARVLGDAMNEIAGGNIAFPKVGPIWNNWFRYLLPYALGRIHEYSHVYPPLLISTFTAFMSVYPKEITEEYKGFRNDMVYALGTRIFPQVLSLDNLEYEDILAYLLTNLYYGEQPVLYEEFSLPMLYGLKYLNPIEIEDWVKSIMDIKNHAWYLGFMTWWLALNNFLQLARDWPQSGNIETILKAGYGFMSEFWITKMPFSSLDAFIPNQNLAAFQKHLSHHLTFDVFQAWFMDIVAHNTLSHGTEIFPLSESALAIIEGILETFQQEFFHV